MGTLFSDNFNRANNSVVDATNWTEHESGASVWSISSNQLAAAGGATMIVLLTTTSAHAAIADCKVSIKRITGSGFDGGVCARASDNNNLYYLDAYQTNKFEVYRVIDGTHTLVAARNVNHAANDIYMMEISGTGATVTIRAYRNGVQSGADISDTDVNRITTAGSTGVIAWEAESFDDFLAEDLTGGGQQFQQSMGGSITPAGALAKQTNKTLGGAITPTGALLKLTQKLLAGAITPTGALIKQAQKLVSGAITPTGALIKQAGKTLTDSITPTGALIKLVVKAFAGSITPTGLMTALKIILLALAGSITPAGSLTKQTLKTLAGAVTPVGTLLKQVSKTFGGSITPSAAVAALKIILLSLAGSIAPAGSLTKQAAKTLAGSIAPEGTLRKLISKFFSGAITPIATLIAQLVGASAPRVTASITGTEVTRAVITHDVVTSAQLADALTTRAVLNFDVGG